MLRAGSAIDDNVVHRRCIEVIARDQARGQGRARVYGQNRRSACYHPEGGIVGDDRVRPRLGSLHVGQGQRRIGCAREVGATEPPLVSGRHVGQRGEGHIITDKNRLACGLNIKVETWRSDYGDFGRAERPVIKADLIQRSLKAEPVNIVRQPQLDLLIGRPRPRCRIGLETARCSIDIYANVPGVRLIVNVCHMMPQAVVD